MNIDLSGKLALVTGSTSGIGHAIAAGLLAAGANVVINGRSPERVAAAVEQLGGAPRVTGIAADVGTAYGCQILTDTVPSIDILVNNAGIFRPKPLLEIEDSEWTEIMEVNVMSGVRLTRHFLPGMIRKNWGRVVFVSSESALQVPPEMVHYGVSKTAQLAVARGYAEAAVNSGVTVNSILPGPTLSEGVATFVSSLMGDAAASAEEAGALFVREHRPSSLIGRLATTEEVASLVVYLASHQASAITGSAMRVDGGVLRAVV
ncbi:SDR family NAD(P)-dependent oxidoreductase [Xanthomonas arboricola pv. corylina]|uniref:NAD(P)-dependent dehydrogenase, short-chain alcohol dehydrogenase family n=1 Tax=Phytopseudomonas flavescens TaxID=29435 RepID=A0A1G8F7S7_9GAMM|nr:MULTISPECIES: SDR family oxidoreductase [Gammaproteobacteria]PPT40574.1 NAD(P)-dependent oxidoreductase [Xanthomonas arboricola]QUI81865.1 SDR family oxidoreductase [Xanthomonas arboricola pv. corylina]SDH78158.1 NAD(P)-dependent dehydrogenase, short-chain alcohol dehydrogenase family [Pseudomonas flavescens]